MTTRDVMRIAFAEPFRPFRIRTTEGRTLDVHDPEATHVGRSRLTLSVFLADIPDGPGPVYEIPLGLIESIEPLDGPGSNPRESLS